MQTMTGLIIPRGSNMLAKTFSKFRLVGGTYCAFATILWKLKCITSFSKSHRRPKTLGQFLLTSDPSVNFAKDSSSVVTLAFSGLRFSSCSIKSFNTLSLVIHLRNLNPPLASLFLDFSYNVKALAVFCPRQSPGRLPKSFQSFLSNSGSSSLNFEIWCLSVAFRRKGDAFKPNTTRQK